MYRVSPECEQIREPLQVLWYCFYNATGEAPVRAFFMEKIMEQNFIEDNIVILSKQTIDEFLKQENPADLISLYIFYYYTAKWQKTNQPKCTTSYAAKGLKKSEDWIRKTKKVLIDLGLIEDHKDIDKETKKVKGWYIKLNYIWKQETINHPMEKPESGFNYTVDLQETNALSVNNINALRVNNINALEESKNDSSSLKKEIYKFIIDGFYNYYNKQYNITGKERGSAKRISEKIYKQDNWKEILKSQFESLLKKQKENPKFWSITITKFEWGWNELLEMSLKNMQSDQQTDNILNYLQEKRKCS